MKTPPEMRDLACRLLAYEDTTDKFSDLTESATLRVYEKLRRSLSAFAGVAGFQSIASRALTLARTEVAGLSAVRISPDGYLQGFEDSEYEIEIHRMNKDESGECPASEAGIILVARVLGLLHIFLGEALTTSLLRDAWPGAAFYDHNSGNGRKA